MWFRVQLYVYIVMFLYRSVSFSLALFFPLSFSSSLPFPFLLFVLLLLLLLLFRLVLPLGQSYVMAGYFSVGKKILRALVENAIFYATLGIIFIILLIYLVVVQKVVAL